ncbi:MAG: hypothetical protein IIT73_04060 [Treponema sp.]|nr:hypothetical protein [Treponema sp.]
MERFVEQGKRRKKKNKKARPESKTMRLDPTGLLFCKLQSPDFTGNCIQLIS